MVDIKYRNDNEDILDNCCMVIKYHQNKAKAVKEAKHSTRIAIQDKLEQKKLREDDELYG